MSAPRVDRVSGPLVVGQFYLVPTVWARWISRAPKAHPWRHDLAEGAWPVIGPKHADVEFFDFRQAHYHVDARFLPPGDSRSLMTLTYPVHGRDGMWTKDGKPEPLPPIVWRRRKCIRAGTEFDPGNSSQIKKMRGHFAGVQCARNAAGFVCPHQQAPLGSVAPKDGVIVCPLHGLHIDAATGVVLPA